MEKEHPPLVLWGFTPLAAWAILFLIFPPQRVNETMRLATFMSGGAILASGYAALMMSRKPYGSMVLSVFSLEFERPHLFVAGGLFFLDIFFLAMVSIYTWPIAWFLIVRHGLSTKQNWVYRLNIGTSLVLVVSLLVLHGVRTQLLPVPPSGWTGADPSRMQTSAGNSNEDPLALAKWEGKWGFINAKGEFAIAPVFDGAGRFAADLAPVQFEGKWGFIDSSGKVAIQFVYERAFGFFRQNLALVQKSGRFLYVDKTGMEMMAPKGISRDSLVPVRIDGKWGYTDMDGKVVIVARYEDARMFSEELGAVRLGGNFGYINRKDEFVIQPQYWKVKDFSENLAAVRRDDGWAYIDKNNKVIITVGFNWPGDFSEGLAYYRSGYKYGFMDKTGRRILPPMFRDAWAFADGVAEVQMLETDKRVYINHDGNYVVDPGRIESFSEGRAAFKDGDKWGYVDKKGTLVIPPRYQTAGRFQNGMAKVTFRQPSQKPEETSKQFEYLIDTQGNFLTWQAEGNTRKPMGELPVFRAPPKED